MPELDDIDPGSARTVAEFALCLRRLRARAGHPSLRDMEVRARRLGRRLPRSSVSDALAGKRLPRKELMLDLVQVCGVSAATDTRWVRAWSRLADQDAADAAAQSGERVSLAEVDALVAAERLLADATQARRVADLEIAELRAAAQRQIDRALARAADAQRRARLSATLARDVSKTGLRRIGAMYLPDLDWNTLFADVRELDIFMAYGQTWFSASSASTRQPCSASIVTAGAAPLLFRCSSARRPVRSTSSSWMSSEPSSSSVGPPEPGS